MKYHLRDYPLHKNLTWCGRVVDAFSLINRVSEVPKDVLCRNCWKAYHSWWERTHPELKARLDATKEVA